VKGDHEPDGEGQGQFALSLGGDAMLVEDVRDRGVRNGLGEGVEGQRLAELAFGVNLSYCESHEVAPVFVLSGLALESMTQKSPLSLFVRYWG
jgi:hypothetical protein